MRLSAATIDLRLHARTLLFLISAVLLTVAVAITAGDLGGRPAQASKAPEAIPQLADGVVYAVSPTEADPRITRFTANNLILFRLDVPKNVNLLVFFPPTGGTPANSWPFMEAAAKAGYRVIGLEYDNATSVPQICGKNPDPACSDAFRQKRVFGDDDTKDIDDLSAEAIVPRLTALLRYLDVHHQAEGWNRYLTKAGPRWSRIAVAGHSQGAGMAAYIAKKERVARVIVLSGAWDRTEVTKTWAPWITSPSATPADRWYAAYHQKETRADAMKVAYVALKIPPSHIRVMTLDPRPGSGANPRADLYHGSMDSPRLTPVDSQGNPAYAAEWSFLLGSPE